MDSVAGAYLRVMLPVLFLVAEVVHERSQVNQEIGIGSGRQRCACAGMRGIGRRRGTGPIAARTEDRHRETNDAQRCEPQELAAAGSWHRGWSNAGCSLQECASIHV